jgi:EF-hand domain pair
MYLARIFMVADHNRDRYLNEDEFEAVRTADPIFGDADFSVFDANGDGRISRTEFVSEPNPLFAIYDRDKTCRVTQVEIDAVKAASQAQPQKGGRSGGRKGAGAGAPS